MTKEEYIRIADLLRRRDNQREYAAENRKRIGEYTDKLAIHINEINKIQRELVQLGYKGQ